MAANILLPLLSVILLSTDAQKDTTMRSIRLNYDSNESISKICQDQFHSLDLNNMYKIMDASGSISDGLSDLNLFHLGDFEACYNVAANTTSGKVYGKYCLATVPFESLANGELLRIFTEKFTRLKVDLSDPKILGKGIDLYNVHIGLCLPHLCGLEDFRNLTGQTVQLDDNFCYSQVKEPVMDRGAVITISFLGAFFMIVLSSTILDIHLPGKNLPRLLLAFSLHTNGRQLLSTSKNREQILCLNGIKALSTMWVILCHVYANVIMGPVYDYGDIIRWKENTTNWLVAGSSVAVDTFFTISGLVVVYTFLKATDKGTKFNLFSFYIHRYIRLTPALAVIVLIHVTLIKYLGSGPMWHTVQDDLVKSCEQYWWSALLYVQNIFHGDGTCVPQTWYLSVDFQLFFFSPIVLVPLKWKPKLAFVLMGILIVLGMVVPFAITYQYQLVNYIMQPPINNTNIYWMYYKQTHTRFGPYVIGMLAGYLIYNQRTKKSKLQLNSVTVTLCWILTVAGLSVCLFFSHQQSGDYDRLIAACINGFRRNIWSACLCVFIGLCITGHGRPLDRFLSLDVFQILNKLSYSMYLTHYAPVTMRYAGAKIPYPFTNQYLMMMFWGDFALTLVLSLILYLTFESPMVTVEQLIFGASAKMVSSQKKQLNRHI